MKKYVKPVVRIEKFTLSDHIAACTFDMILTQEEVREVMGNVAGEPFGVQGKVGLTNSYTNCQ